MAAKKAKVSYDQEEDIFYVHLDTPIADSLEHGNYIIDFSKDNRIVGLEILNASKNIFAGIQSSEEMDIKKSLATVKSALFGIHEDKRMVWIGVLFVVQIQNKERTHSIQIDIPHVMLSK